MSEKTPTSQQPSHTPSGACGRAAGPAPLAVVLTYARSATVVALAAMHGVLALAGGGHHPCASSGKLGTIKLALLVQKGTHTDTVSV